jgi:thioester reductase-like protein
MPRRKVFFTGFPGFIGRTLVKQILKETKDTDFVFLVQDRFVPEAVRETDRLKADERAGDSQMDVLSGDISLFRLGLSDKKYEELLSQITDVFHLAAIYDLAVPEEIARKVNVTGTRNVVELCKAVRGLKTLVYFSTCYVAGKRTGTILEDELEMGQGFKNHYEETKFEAEVIVRDAMKEVPTIVIRPAVVVGDSKTGETQKFDGPYFGMILIDALKILQIPLPYLGDSEAEVNLVPIDFIFEATVALWKKRGATGKTYQLADPNPVMARTLYSEIIRLLGARGPFLKIPPVVMDVPLRAAMVRKLLGVPREVLDYFNHKCHYDSKSTQEALEGTGIRVPYFLDYLPTLVDFYKRNKHRKELRWRAY